MDIDEFSSWMVWCERRPQPIGAGSGDSGGGGSQLAPNGLGSDKKLSDADCDKKLASIFGGPGAVVGSSRDPATLGSLAGPHDYYARSGRPLPANFGARAAGHGPEPYNNPNPRSPDRGVIIHVYNDAQGSGPGPLYAPSGGTVGPLGTDSQNNTFIRASYSTGLTITFVHVSAASGGPTPRVQLASAIWVGRVEILPGTSTATLSSSAVLRK
jgi:hypothetical protein